MQVLGLDIGGANIKAATADGKSVSIAFPIWQNRNLLTSKLREITLLQSGAPEIVAITMTAELADCFVNKAEGVEFIISAVVEVFSESLIRVWLTSGEFAEPEDAIELPQIVAASNWHALATWAGRAIPTGPALLIDVGSTTTDIIPLLDGIPVSEGLTDIARLESGELLYTGVRRTPICAMVQSVPLLIEDRGPNNETRLEQFIPVAAELFATVQDAHLLNGDLAADANDMDTADGRPFTRDAAMNRLAHMLCCDRSELSDSQLQHIAAFIAETQLAQLCTGIHNRLDFLAGLQPQHANSEIRILVSGSGAWLAERAIQKIDDARSASVSNLATMFVQDISTCAPAFAVARLAAERCLDDLLPVSPW